MKVILVLFLLLFGITLSGLAQSSDKTFRESNRVSVSPVYVYKIHFFTSETEKDISNRLKSEFQNISVFFPNDSILIIQSDYILDNEFVNKIIKKGKTSISDFSYTYFNNGLVNKKDSVVISENRVYKKRRL